jgi:geranylgeranyl reductase family protein
MSVSQVCDVAIIGAGPAGATAAFLLSKHGYDVCLFDRRNFPRPKLCAGLLTWKSIVLLEHIFGLTLDRLKDQGLIVHSCQEYRIFYKMKEIGHGRLNFPFHFVHRPTYDLRWLGFAEAAGARTITGTAVTKVDAEAGRLTLADGREFSAHMIIGADGVWSKARRALPEQIFCERRWRADLAATIEIRRPHENRCPPPDFTSLHFGYVPWGYAWSFPGKDARTLGIAGLRRSRSESIRDAFRTFLQSIGFDDATEEDWKGYPLPYGNHLHQPAHRRLLLVGDACGLADPLLGEGIYYAHASARIAAQAIIEGGLEAEPAGRIYRERLNRDLIRELRWIKLWRTALFMGGRHRRYRGLRLFCRLLPKRLEATVQGQRSFSRLLLP